MNLLQGDGNSSFDEDTSDISGETDQLNDLPSSSARREKRRRSEAITEKFGTFLSPWGKMACGPCKSVPPIHI